MAKRIIAVIVAWTCGMCNYSGNPWWTQKCRGCGRV